jgi:hypothetical protein
MINMRQLGRISIIQVRFQLSTKGNRFLGHRLLSHTTFRVPDHHQALCLGIQSMWMLANPPSTMLVVTRLS